MFYSNKVKTKATKKYKITYSSFASGMNTEVDDNLLPHKQGKVVYNYEVKNGALKTGLGFKELTLPNTFPDEFGENRVIEIYQNKNITNLWHFRYYDNQSENRKHKIMYTTKDGDLCYFDVLHYVSNSFKVPDIPLFTSVPVAINYRLNGEDCMIFSSPTDSMLVFTQNYLAQTYEDAPKLVSVCIHYERLFAILEGERNTLVFSANLDPTAWDYNLDEAGFIQMVDERGSMCAVLSFNDYVYVFRDYGVARVSAYGSLEDFSVSQLFISSVKIYGGTVCSCGDRIMFLAKDGIHYFGGYSTTKLNLGIESMFEGIENESASAVFHNGKYYLACKLNFPDDEVIGCESGSFVNNALIEYDLTTGEINITRGVDINKMISLEEGEISKLVACFNGTFANKMGELTHDGKLFGTPLKSVWLSPNSNLGYAGKQKCIKEVYLKSEYDCKVIIKSDIEEKEYIVSGKPKTQRIKTNVRGEYIEISFISEQADANISCPEVVLSVYG